MQNFYDFCRDNIYDFEDRYDTALSTMDIERCSMSRADNTFYNTIQHYAEIYCGENELDFDGFDIEDELMN